MLLVYRNRYVNIIRQISYTYTVGIHQQFLINQINLFLNILSDLETDQKLIVICNFFGQYVYVLIRKRLIHR